MSLFDGMTGILSDVFGVPVTHFPAVGGSVTVPAIFREEPVAVLDDGGREILTVAATLRIAADRASGIARGDRVAPGNGKTYRVMNRTVSGSPAADGFAIFQLEEMD